MNHIFDLQHLTQDDIESIVSIVSLCGAVDLFEVLWPSISPIVTFFKSLTYEVRTEGGGFLDILMR